MTVTDIQMELMTEVDRLGMAARVVSVQHLAELADDIAGPRDAGLLDRTLVETFLNWFDFTIPSDLPRASHIVVLAHPEPISEAGFAWEGSPHLMVIPPTYLPTSARQNLRALRSLIERHGYHTARTKLPLKALAVRSGLGRYGRNNVCYVQGMGSFLLLDAFYTDAPLNDDGWGEKTLMEICTHCSACESSCPTASIAPDRFMIRAEKCLTFLNELDGDFPGWVQPQWHNALIGCMRCQTVCPENAALVDHSVLVASFSEDETKAVITATALDQLDAQLQAKLARLDWGTGNFSLMQRNLRALLVKDS